jgi:ABC-type transporter Mla subunit MlaD
MKSAFKRSAKRAADGSEDESGDSPMADVPGEAEETSRRLSSITSHNDPIAEPERSREGTNGPIPGVDQGLPSRLDQLDGVISRLDGQLDKFDQAEKLAKTIPSLTGQLDETIAAKMAKQQDRFDNTLARIEKLGQGLERQLEQSNMTAASLPTRMEQQTMKLHLLANTYQLAVSNQYNHLTKVSQ